MKVTLNRLLAGLGLTDAPAIFRPRDRSSRYLRVRADDGRAWDLDLIADRAEQIAWP